MLTSVVRITDAEIEFRANWLGFSGVWGLGFRAKVSLAFGVRVESF